MSNSQADNSLRIPPRKNVYLQSLLAQFLSQLALALSLLPVLLTISGFQTELIAAIASKDISRINSFIISIAPGCIPMLASLPLLILIWYPLSHGISTSGRNDNPAKHMFANYFQSLPESLYRFLRLLPVLLLLPLVLFICVLLVNEVMNMNYNTMLNYLKPFGSTMVEMFKGLLKWVVIVLGSFTALWFALLLWRLSVHSSYAMELQSGASVSAAWRVGARKTKGKKARMLLYFIECFPLYAVMAAAAYGIILLGGSWVVAVLAFIPLCALPLSAERYLYQKLW
ncbi:MAG: hypothetical protein PHI27_05205 [Eubacteriales bacterium]|nr:hypothetical protein [Eubacteriales bacterium]MDD3881631.1 hypothetical protein [Eubacteriales bacterium]MDD4512310.1 hypothetical protein [Eubacteriales bacterium]